MPKHNPNSLFYLKSFNFFIFGSIALLMPFLPLYFNNLGFDPIQIGLLMACGPIISIFANPFWGYWSDKLQNIRRVIGIMLIGNLVFSTIFFQMSTFYLVYLFMLGFFFFQSALNTMTNSVILHAIENTKFNFGTFRIWGSIGFAIMAVSAGPLIGWIGIDKLGYIYGLFLLITISFTIRLPQQGRSSQKFSLHGLSKVVMNGYFICFLLLGIFISIPNQMNFTFISIHIENLGGNVTHVGWSWFAAAILEVPIFLILDRYLKRTPSFMVALLAIVSFLYALRWVLMMMASTPLQLIFIQLTQCLTFGVFFYVGTILCTQLIPSVYRASGQAMYALTWMGASGIITGFLGGWLFDSYGAQTMYGAGVAMSVVGVLGFLVMWRLLLRKEKRERQPEQAFSLSNT